MGGRSAAGGQVYGWALWLASGLGGGCSHKRETPGERQAQNPEDAQEAGGRKAASLF